MKDWVRGRDRSRQMWVGKIYSHWWPFWILMSYASSRSTTGELLKWVNLCSVTSPSSASLSLSLSLTALTSLALPSQVSRSDYAGIQLPPEIPSRRSQHCWLETNTGMHSQAKWLGQNQPHIEFYWNKVWTATIWRSWNCIPNNSSKHPHTHVRVFLPELRNNHFK